MRQYLKITAAAVTALAFVAGGCENKQPVAPAPQQAAPAAPQQAKVAAPAPQQAAPAAPAEVVKAPAPTIDYDQLSLKIAKQIDTDAIATKVVDKMKAEKLIAPPTDVPNRKIPPIKEKIAMDKKDGERVPPKKDDTKRPPRPVDKTVWKVDVRGDEPMKGNANALVTLILFSDFQCPFCGRVEPTLDEVAEKYGDKVRILWKNNPLSFHKDARGAAQAACAAQQQGKFWEMHKALFANQKALGKEALNKYAQELGLDMAKFETDYNSPACATAIDADMKMASDVGARGTPNLYVNGRQVRGAVPFDQIAPVIDEEITKAQALLAGGVAADKLYDEIIKTGKVFTPLGTTAYTFNEPAPFKGQADAPIVVTLFSDFQCPFCSRINPVLDDLLKEYPTNMKLEFRHFPLSFHKDAHLAAQATMAADAEGKFWEMHEKLFANQKALTRADLEKYAGELGLNMDKFKKALDEGTYKDIVDRHFQEGQKSEVRGTPSLYLNGRKFEAPSRDVPTFKKIIDSEILKK